MGKKFINNKKQQKKQKLETLKTQQEKTSKQQKAEMKNKSKEKKTWNLFRRKKDVSNESKIVEKGGKTVKENNEKSKTYNKKKTLLACLVFVIAIVGIAIWRTNMPVIEVEHVAVNGLETAEDGASVTLTLKGATYSIPIQEPSIPNTAGYSYDGIDIVKKATELLGASYSYGTKGGNVYSDGTAYSSSYIKNTTRNRLCWINMVDFN